MVQYHTGKVRWLKKIHGSIKYHTEHKLVTGNLQLNFILYIHVVVYNLSLLKVFQSYDKKSSSYKIGIKKYTYMYVIHYKFFTLITVVVSGKSMDPWMAHTNNTEVVYMYLLCQIFIDS